jgi:hypothetical protein
MTDIELLIEQARPVHVEETKNRKLYLEGNNAVIVPNRNGRIFLRLIDGSLFNIAHFVYSDTGTIPHCAWGCGAPYSYAWASWIEACPGSCL